MPQSFLVANKHAGSMASNVFSPSPLCLVLGRVLVLSESDVGLRSASGGPASWSNGLLFAFDVRRLMTNSYVGLMAQGKDSLRHSGRLHGNGYAPQGSSHGEPA